MKGIERRKSPRVFLRALVDYAGEDTFLYDYSKDLSEGGIFIHTENPLNVGDTLELKFSLPDVEKVFAVKGEVRWANTKDEKGVMKGMGVEFKDLKPEDKKLIQTYIQKYAAKKEA